MYNNLWTLYSDNTDYLIYNKTRREARGHKRRNRGKNWNIVKFSQKSGPNNGRVKLWGVYSEDLPKYYNDIKENEVIFGTRCQARQFARLAKFIGCRDCKIKRYVDEGIVR